ncbi:hypothetical protein GM661_03465 [Iocasia frigidifontis]|uniref:Uncharacterized protein n=1 Tax=Iocasia fonsfrigidae TaxID=2682810 RepID=A0A8A7KGV0_9FIRM|nr:hypothetical protein [Iocasia fonsfrigidae]QTL97102.1 hypothetical protein GM661_03465 [Iocasia fonsfrigidae]
MQSNNAILYPITKTIYIIIVLNGGEMMGDESLLDIVWAFFYGYVKKILNSLVNNLWDELWVEIIKGVNLAEQKWKESGQGEAKKKWVMEQVMTFINEQTELNWLQKKLVYIFVDKTIDALIDTFNEELGKDWGNKVAEWKEMLEGKIPFID